jgi:hypothetical protein
MRLRHAALLLPLLSCAHAPARPDQKATNLRAAALAHDVLLEYFTQNVSLATMLRVPGARFDALPPASLAEIRAVEARQDALRKRLDEIDGAGVGDPSARLGLAVAREYLRGNAYAGRSCGPSAQPPTAGRWCSATSRRSSRSAATIYARRR